MTKIRKQRTTLKKISFLLRFPLLFTLWIQRYEFIQYVVWEDTSFLYKFFQLTKSMDGVYGILVEVLYHVFKDFLLSGVLIIGHYNDGRLMPQ